MRPYSIAGEHVVIAKHYFWIRKIIEVQISRNTLMEAKLSTKSVGAAVLHDEVVLMTVRDKTRTNADKISKVSS